MMRSMASWISRNRSGIFLTMGLPLSRHALGYALAALVLLQHRLCDRASPVGPSEVLQGQRGYALAPNPQGDRYHSSSQLRRVQWIQKYVYWMRHAWLLCEECPRVSPAKAR